MEELNCSSSSSDEGKNCRRGHWRPAEDDKLRELVEQFGPRNWNSIAEKIEGRTGKSCRLRWFNQLDPRINRKPFSEEEEERLLSSHKKYGNKWSLISRLFPGRTDNAVKNHFHVIIARQRRERPRIHNQGIVDEYRPRESNTISRHISLEYLRNPKRSDIFSISPSNASSWEYSGLFNLKKSIHSGQYKEDSHNYNGAKKRNYENFDTNSFGFSNLGIGYDGTQQKISSESTRLDDHSSTYSKHQMAEQESRQSNQHKDDIQFIDFLGVGISS